MAFDRTNINHGGGPEAPGGMLIVYYTTDAAATVEADGYFDEMADNWENRDTLLCVMSDASKIYKLTVTAGDVALSLGLAIT